MCVVIYTLASVFHRRRRRVVVPTHNLLMESRRKPLGDVYWLSSQYACIINHTPITMPPPTSLEVLQSIPKFDQFTYL